MAEKIQAIIFDMDGLLLDTERLSLNAWNAVCTSHNFDLTSIYPQLIGKGIAVCDMILMNHFGSDFPLLQMRNAKNVHFDTLIDNQGILVKEGVHELFEFSNTRGVATALATSSTREEATRRLKAANVTHTFDVIVCGDEVLKTKPAPDLFLTASERLKISPEFCLVLEDSHAGVEGALAAGCQVIMVPDLVKPEGWIFDCQVAVMSSLIQVRDLLKQL